LETLLRSLGWALTKSELERIRQTFDTGDASLGHVSSDDFIEVFAEATSPSEGKHDKWGVERRNRVRVPFAWACANVAALGSRGFDAHP
jgi:hypothetical protein